jgi:exopolysaccharide biosynthesis polyprenyl glycosylphosphotransferase
MLTSLRHFNKRVLIYGAGELGQALYRSIVNSPKLGIVPVGFIDDDQKKKGTVCYPSGFNCSNGIAVLGTGKNIPQIKEALDVDEVYLAISDIDYDVLRKILDFLKQERIKVSFVPNLYKVMRHKLKIDQIGQIPIAREEADFDSPYLGVKRYLDLLLALILACLSWPVLAAIAVAIKMDSKGPVLFKHQRVGKDGKVFYIYKFRTMFKDTAPYAVNPLTRKDPRITRAGRFLRRSSLDELPQLINVIKGDMSFVGPRPEMPFIAAEYGEIHKERLTILPGITGLWQLSGDRKKPIHENMDYDLYYIRNVSFFLDVAILIETIVFALRGI